MAKRVKGGPVGADDAQLPPQPLPSGSSQRTAKCSVCGGECAPTSTEELCWVCRRLKISAWREVDTQPSVQE